MRRTCSWRVSERMAERVAGIRAWDPEEEQALVSAVGYDDARVAGVPVPLERDRVTVVVAYVELHEHDRLLSGFGIFICADLRTSLRRRGRSAEGEDVRAHAGVEKRDLERARALAPRWRTSWYIHGSVTVPSPDSSTSRPWASPGGRPSRRTAKRTVEPESGGSRTRLTSRAWKRYAIEPAGASSAAASSRTDHLPLSAHRGRNRDRF